MKIDLAWPAQTDRRNGRPRTIRTVEEALSFIERLPQGHHEWVIARSLLSSVKSGNRDLLKEATSHFERKLREKGWSRP
jgi:hypothetical protein